MEEENLPHVSFIIPTYNEEKRIEKCLDSIFYQDYPFDKIEVIVVDGMSTDNTVKLAKKYRTRIIYNPKRIVSSALKIAVQNSKYNIIAPIPADCILHGKCWLRKMIKPFSQLDVAGVVTLIIPKNDFPAISRFFALVQADPIILFAHGTGETLKGDVITKENYFPTQGFLLRKDLVLEVGNFNPRLVRSEDVDLTYRLVKRGYKLVMIRDAGIYHLFMDSFPSFLNKFYKRILVFADSGLSYDFNFLPQKFFKFPFLKNILYSLTIIGALVNVQRGMRKKPDLAWFYYPIIVLATIMLYAVVLLTRSNGRKVLRDFLTH